MYILGSSAKRPKAGLMEFLPENVARVLLREGQRLARS